MYCKTHNIVHKGRREKMLCRLTIAKGITKTDDFMEVSYNYRRLLRETGKTTNFNGWFNDYVRRKKEEEQ